MAPAKYPLVLSSPHEKGPLVREAQAALQRNQYGRFYDGDVDGDYGPLTAQATFRAKFWLGYADGQLNQAYGASLHKLLTGEAKLAVDQQKRRAARKKESTSVPRQRRMLEVAAAQIGKTETPPNSNIALPYTAWYGWRGWGAPWCAVFVSWCAAEAGFACVKPGERWAYCPYMVADARAARNGLVLVRNPAPGSVVLYDWDGGAADHVGLFEKWVEPGRTFTAIEGNTAFGNDSNGGKVMRRERNVSQVEVFARFTR